MTPTQLLVEPERPSLDTVLRIGVSGLPSGRELTLRATLRDPAGRTWASVATFAADADGTVDLHRDAPVTGSYRGVDPMGPIWSMDLCDESTGTPDALAPTPLRLVAEVGGEPVATAEVDQLRVPDGVTLTEVDEDGLVGVVCCPAEAGRLPAVLLLGGSEGGMHVDDAALLAGHGYAVLVLAYYGLPGLPDTLERVPLEYFGRALDYLAAHPRVDADRIAVSGASKGGEAALLVAATFPRARAAISVVGSGLVTQGIGQSIVTGSFLDILGTPVPCWTHGGRPVPYLPNVVTPELAELVAAGAPVPLRLAFTPALDLTDLVPEATIPVERIRGDVLLVSTVDDQGYGIEYHDVAAKRLAAHGRPYRHVVYPDAGHAIAAPPYAPTTRLRYPGPGVTFEAGGTPAGTAAARAGSWHEILDFLATTMT
jgi:dienelactone hydrolase